MNKLTDWCGSFCRRRLAAVLLAFVFMIPALRAQPTEQTVQSRFLFIFDTSKNMKPRLEALQKCLNILLATSLGGQMHAGDSMGVWTFNQALQTKGFPLQNWNPDNAVSIASNLVKFVGAQHYGKSTHFEVLQPSLNRVVQNSERLTVLIFCDGEGKISGTPYDDAINQVLQEKLAEQKNARQPLVIVLRSQLGQFVGGQHRTAAAAGEHPGVPAVAIAAAARDNPDQSAAARADDRRPAAHHHRQKAHGQCAAARAPIRLRGRAGKRAPVPRRAAANRAPRRQPIRSW